MTEYQTLKQRIEQANTEGGLKLLESRINWYYDNGLIDQIQFRKLDNKIFVKLAKLD